MNRIPPPNALQLSGNNVSSNWKIFKQMWLNYEIATGLLDEENPEKRIATFLAYIGEEALKVYNTFTWNVQSDQRNLNKVLEKFDEFCNPKKNTTYERYVFNCRKQKCGETIDDYVTDLKTLSQNCEYGQIKDSLIRDNLILGINNNHLRENMLRDPDLTLEKTIQMAKASERAKLESQKISNDVEPIEDVNQVKDNRRRTQFSQCKFCGRNHKFDRKLCPAYTKTCNNCGGSNHFAKMCNKQTSNKINEVCRDESFSDNEIYIE